MVALFALSDGPLAPDGLVAARRERRSAGRARRRLLRPSRSGCRGRLTSDGLTALGWWARSHGRGVRLSTLSAAWLWAASALLVVNWLATVPDGTLARVRRVERPRYGYYLDHIVDAFSTAAIGAMRSSRPMWISERGAGGRRPPTLILSIKIYLESSGLRSVPAGVQSDRPDRSSECPRRRQRRRWR